MELFANAARTYKTRKNAIKALSAVADLERVRWFIIATPEGRFTPCVVVSPNGDNLGLAHHGVCVVG